jgi:SAM-dependent methyltransferase
MPDYLSSELGPMALAHNYYRWIMREFRPHLWNVVCELGAGIGTFSSLLLEEDIQQLILVEPAHNLFAYLRDHFTTEARVQVVNGEIERHAERLRQGRVDTIVSVNVLEHIDDDHRTLATITKILSFGGTLLLFVPALPWLFGSLDATFGHFRRYRKTELEEKVTEAGFQILDLKFMNFPGIVTWFVAGRILRSSTISPLMVRSYDRLIIPIVKAIESRITAPLGQSLMLIAQLT